MRLRLILRLLLLALIISSTDALLAKTWQESVLYSFQGGSDDGNTPMGGVVFDKQGNLYGTALGGNPGPGVVFQLAPPAQKGDPWTETLIYQFQTLPDGDDPNGGLIIDKSGNLYGVTAYGGTGDCILVGIKVGCGTVYEVSPPTQKDGPWTERILYSFQGGDDGYVPNGNMGFDKEGNLYGATTYGGGYGSCNSPYYEYCGTVFKLTPPKQKGDQWTEKVLYSFKGGTDGANPNGGFTLDREGTIYSTSWSGGVSAGCNTVWSVGCGTVFSVVPPTKNSREWKERVLHRFNAEEGSNPGAGVVANAAGDLYGTTFYGPPDRFGLVFELRKPHSESQPWHETLLYEFTNRSDGAYPDAGVILDTRGNLYGTNIGNVLYRLERPQEGGTYRETTIHTFTGPPDGRHPAATLILRWKGALYSTSQWGGTGAGCQGGCGTVFEISP